MTVVKTDLNPVANRIACKVSPTAFQRCVMFSNFVREAIQEAGRLRDLRLWLLRTDAAKTAQTMEPIYDNIDAFDIYLMHCEKSIRIVPVNVRDSI